MKEPKFKNTVIKKNGNTGDIIAAVLEADGKSKAQTAELSKQFERSPEGLQKIWNYVKYNFRYVEDPNGQQWIKSPERLFFEREGDCKSFTIFVNSILQNLKIDYTTRFISQNQDKDATHVYTVATLNGKNYIIDTVYNEFNKEPRYTYKYDYKNKNSMTKISYLNGIQQGEKFATEMQKIKAVNFAELTEAEKQEVLLKESFLIDALQKSGAEAAAAAEMFTGFTMQEQDKEAINTAAKEEQEAIKGLAGVGALRIIAAARKKILNTLLRVTLPRTGLIFLYTQVNNKYLSPKAQAKKRRQDKFKQIILQATGITAGTFNMLISNAVKSKTGKTPLQFVKSLYPSNQGATPAPPPRKGATPAPPPAMKPRPTTRKAAAVGFAGAGIVISQAAGYLVGLIQNISTIVKGFKKEDELKAGDAPSPADFDGFADPDAPAGQGAGQGAEQGQKAGQETGQGAGTPPMLTNTTLTATGTEGAGTEDEGKNKKLLLIGAAAAIGIYFIMQSKKK